MRANPAGNVAFAKKYFGMIDALAEEPDKLMFLFVKQKESFEELPYFLFGDYVVEFFPIAKYR